MCAPFAEFMEMGGILGACYVVFFLYIVNPKTRLEFTTWCENTTYTHLCYEVFLAVAFALCVTLGMQLPRECTDFMYTFYAFASNFIILMCCVFVSWLMDICSSRGMYIPIHNVE